MESLEAVGNGSKGAGKNDRNSADLGIDLQGSDTVGALLGQQDLGGDRGDYQSPGGVPPLGGAMDHGDEGQTRGRQRVIVTLSSRVNGSRGDPPHWGVHQEVSGKHSRKGGMPTHI